VKLTDNTKGILFASTAGLLWGLLAIVIKVTLNYVPPKTVAWSRFAVAFIFLFLYHAIFRTGGISIFKKPPFRVLVSAVLLGMNYLCFMEGINVTTPNNAAIFIQSGPLILAVLGFVIYKEKLKPIQIAGFVVALLGFVFFYRDQLANLFSNPQVYNKGILLIVLAGVCWAFYSLIQKRLVKKYHPDHLNLINFGLPIVILIPGVEFSVFTDLPWFAWLILIFLGINTLMAYHFLSLALKYIEANKVSIILTANPTITFLAMAILTSMEVAWIEGEVFSFVTLAGAFLVIMGAVLVSVFKR